jgi:hypothetical protein
MKRVGTGMECNLEVERSIETREKVTIKRAFVSLFFCCVLVEMRREKRSWVSNVNLLKSFSSIEMNNFCRALEMSVE